MSSSKRHLTAATASLGPEKLKHPFLDSSGLLDAGNKRAKSVKEIWFPMENIGLYGVRFNGDATKLIASYGNGAIQVMDAELAIPLFCPKRPGNPAFPIMAIRCGEGASSEVFYGGGICGNVYQCEYAADSCTVFATEKSNEINAMDLDPNTGTLATGGKDGAIRLYDINTGKMTLKLYKPSRSDEPESTAFHSKRIFAIKFPGTRPHTFISGGWDDCVKIWDTRTKDGCIKNLVGPHICGDALDVKENLILTGQWTAEHSLQLWDFSSGKLLATIVPPNRVQTLDGEFLYCCQFLKCEGFTDTIVAGGSGSGYLDVINSLDERIVCTFKVNKLIQALHATINHKIVYGGMENIIRIATMHVSERNLF